MPRSRSLVLVGVAASVSWCQGDQALTVDYDDDLPRPLLTAKQLRALHTLMDSNKDGRVCLQEILDFSNLMTKEMARDETRDILNTLDTSLDGTVSFREHLDGARSELWNEAERDHRMTFEAEKFKAVDSNGDNELDEHELASLLFPETHDGMLALVTAEAMRLMDANGDGRLTAQEYREAVDEEEEIGPDIDEHDTMDFKNLDKNSDSILDLMELRAWQPGVFDMERAMESLLHIADVDGDNHITSNELTSARGRIAASKSETHLRAWAEHNEL